MFQSKSCRSGVNAELREFRLSASIPPDEIKVNTTTDEDKANKNKPYHWLQVIWGYAFDEDSNPIAGLFRTQASPKRPIIWHTFEEAFVDTADGKQPYGDLDKAVGWHTSTEV